MNRYEVAATSVVALLLCGVPHARAQDEVFAIDDHCVAYRTVKDILFAAEAEVIGRSCEVTAALVIGADAGEPRIVVTVPVKSLKSGNIFRNRVVAELLGAEVQPDLRFSSNPLDVESLRSALDQGRFELSGELALGGRSYPVTFPLELLQNEGQRAVRGRLETTFEAFEVEVPTIAFGLVARPHEKLELLVQLQLERVEGLDAWFSQARLP